MYTLSLDEYGDFEGRGTSASPLIIGGVIYNDNGDTDDRNMEKKRIKGYYSMIIDEVKKKKGSGGVFQKAAYPRSLHITDNTPNDNLLVKAVKSTVQETLGEFLQSGTYRGAQLTMNGRKEPFECRKGQYSVYAVIKSADGKSLGLKENAGNLLADGVASNLYLHMINEVMDRCVFNTPYADKGSHFSLNLATRTTKSINRNDEYLDEYTALGYEGIKKDLKDKDILTKEGKLGMFFRLTNADVFRSMITQKMTDDNPEKVYLDELNVESIRYDSKNSGQEFLYLADSICSVLTFGLSLCGSSQDDWLDELIRRMDGLIPRDRQLLFGYDDADTDLSVILRKFHVKDYYGTLESISEASRKGTYFSNFYKERWFKYIEDRIKQDSDIEAFRRAVDALYFSQKSNEYFQSKGIYIARILEQEAEAVKSNISVKESRRVFYRLYECLMIAFCHIGDSARSEEYYNKLSSYAYCATVEDYLRAQNIIVVLLTDSFRWKRALAIVNQSLDICREYSSLRSKLSGNFNIDTESDVAKTESTMGQLYAFMGSEEAEKCFDSSLKHFEIRTSDYYQTQSYLLHYYLDAGLYDRYEYEAKIYFGDRMTDMDRLEFIFEEGLRPDPAFSFIFALYVFVKGLYLRGENTIEDRCWQFLSDIEQNINAWYGERLKHPPFALVNHPSELISKYLMLIAIDRGEIDTAEKYLAKSYAAVAEVNSPLLNAIVLKGELDAIRKKGECSGKRDELINTIYDTIISFNSDVIIDKDADLITKESTIDKYFRYTYN